MPAVVQAGQGHRDVVITPALLHLEVGAANCRRPGTLLQAGELEEVLEKVPMDTNSKVPLAHRFEHRRLLDIVRVEVLELKPILEQHPADESPGGDGEAALMEGHK
jgi:hypothetical protein